MYNKLRSQDDKCNKFNQMTVKKPTTAKKTKRVTNI